MFDRTGFFAEKVATAGSRDKAWELLLTELGCFGISMARYGFITSTHSPHPERDILAFGDFPSEWENIYFRNNCVQNDYVVQHVLKSCRPLTFRELYARLDAGEFSPAMHETHNMGRDFDLHHGIAFALRGAHAFDRGGISVVAEKDVSEGEFSQTLKAHIAEINELCQAFHCSLDRNLLLSDHGPLSPREQECLLWVSCGLRTKQIAHKLGTHEKTVDKQLQSARMRLKAATNAQAAVKAVMLGLITP